MRRTKERSMSNAYLAAVVLGGILNLILRSLRGSGGANCKVKTLLVALLLLSYVSFRCYIYVST